MKDNGVYKSWTHGPLPASVWLKVLMLNLRESVGHALRAGSYSVHGDMLAHARGELVKYVGGLEAELRTEQGDSNYLREQLAKTEARLRANCDKVTRLRTERDDWRATWRMQRDFPPGSSKSKAPRKMVRGDIYPVHSSARFSETYRTDFPTPESVISRNNVRMAYEDKFWDQVVRDARIFGRFYTTMPFTSIWGDTRPQLERRAVPPADLDVLYWPASAPQSSAPERRSGKDRRGAQDWSSPQMRRGGGARRKS